MAYIPPYEVLKDGIGTSPDGELVIMSGDLFRMFLAVLAQSAGFDPAWYREQHPDVAEAIRQGEISDEIGHFVTFGYQEGRAASRMTVDEDWYRDAYPDVDDAIFEGTRDSAEDHYNDTGYFEGRVPDAASENEILRWRMTIAQSKDALSETDGEVILVPEGRLLHEDPT